MPQELHVVLCVSCKRFQVQIVKKTSKWTCKLCNTKQSVQQVYCKGTGAECRNAVARLNEARGAIEERGNQAVLEQIEAELEQGYCVDEYEEDGNQDQEYYCCEESEQAHNQPEQVDLLPQPSGILAVAPAKSKWTVFLEN